MPKRKKKKLSELEKKLEELKEKSHKEADELLAKTMPEHIKELRIFLRDEVPKLLKGFDDPQYYEFQVDMDGSPNAKPTDDEKGEPPAKKRKLNDDAPSRVPRTAELRPWRKKHPRNDDELRRLSTKVKSNEPIVRAMSQITRRFMTMIEILGTLKHSISLRIPKMGDGNNFGVQVQEEVIGEIGNAEEKCFKVLEDSMKYFEDRAKIVSKILKWPQVPDWRTSLKEYDYQEANTQRYNVRDLLNDYTVVLDLMQKNIEKIKEPRPAYDGY